VNQKKNLNRLRFGLGTDKKIRFSGGGLAAKRSPLFSIVSRFAGGGGSVPHKSVAARPREKENKHLEKASRIDVNSLLWSLNTTPKGLSQRQIQANRYQYGPNSVTKEKKKSKISIFVESFANPFTFILLGIAAISAFTDIISPFISGNYNEINPATVIIITVLVVMSCLMNFIQESKSSDAAESLMAMVKNNITVDREGKGKIQIPVDQLVVGDVFYLSAGDMIPADARVISSKSLVISQASLTGESDQLERNELQADKNYDSLTERPNLVFMGSNVVSGSARAVVLETGDHTMLGSIARTVTTTNVQSGFEKGVNDISWILIKFMLVMVPIVFIVNGFTKGDWVGSFVFALSIAIGLTPEMLPMIVTSCLSKGVIAMSKKKTIIKRLSSVQNFGAMDILCTDKTGTLTADKIVLELYINPRGELDEKPLRFAFLNSNFQTGLCNAMDEAIIKYTDEKSKEIKDLASLRSDYSLLGEIPFDFVRRRLSVIVKERGGEACLITKGAVEEMLSVCSHVETPDGIKDLDEELRKKAFEVTDNLNAKGMRVIALAKKTGISPEKTDFKAKDESDMTLLGYLAFLDPPRESSARALKALKEHGVTTKILTGDNDKVTCSVCKKVGLNSEKFLLGIDVEKMDDVRLSEAAETTVVFAKLSPDQKSRVVSSLRRNGHIVGFMGDGINDASALKKSDIGISVENAVDIAKEAADVILLEKDLMVLEQGIIEGRKTYANMIKYIKITASNNFGNMFSVLVACALIPFMPLASLHIILLNLIYDISCMAIPFDNVDKDFVKRPRAWEAKSITGFMMCNGPVSSLLDWATYAVLYFLICPKFVSNGLLYNQISQSAVINNGIFAGMNTRAAYAALFQTGWLVECIWSQVLVMIIMRTKHIPIVQSRPSKSLVWVSVIAGLVITFIPFTGLNKFFGLVPLNLNYFTLLALILVCYMVLASVVKVIYIKFKKSWL
jgi:Mg2+-importing ATPase